MHLSFVRHVFRACHFKKTAVVCAVSLASCGQKSSVPADVDAKSASLWPSKYAQGIRYLDDNLRNKAIVGDETDRARRWRLNWNPGHCTNPKGPALQISTNLDTFDQGNAYWLSWLSIQAYRQVEATDQLHQMGLTRIDFIQEQSTSFQAFVASNSKYVIVSFAGTSDLTDYMTDVTFASKPEFFPGIPGRVHTGFLNVLEKSWPKVLALVREHSSAGQPIILTGHSLGGAQAVISATRLATLGFPVDSLYIYSVPRIGDESYARHVSKLFPKRIYRFVNNEDVVPRLPPPRIAARNFSMLFPEESREAVQSVFETLSYTHVGSLLMQNARGDLSAPREFSESEDTDYWDTVVDRSRGRSVPAAVFANWRMLFDHIPFASHCQLKTPVASGFTQATDFLE